MVMVAPAALKASSRFHAMKAAMKPPGDAPPPAWDPKRSADLILFFVLMAMGVAYEVVIVKSFNSQAGVTKEVGLVLVGASMTPLLLSFWACVLENSNGPPLPPSRQYARALESHPCRLVFGLGTKRSDDLTRVGITLFAYCFGVLMCDFDVDHVTEWGSKAFFMAMMFIINQLMLIEPDPEVATATLMSKYKQALASAGTGMALSYFYNFVLPTAQSLEACVSADTIAIQLEGAQRGQFSDATFKPLTAPRLNVICPRDLPPTDGDIKKQIRTLTTMEGGLKVGRLLPPKGVGGHRPMFLNFVAKPTDAPPAADAQPQMSAMLDVPTIISASYDRRSGVGKTVADSAPSTLTETPEIKASADGSSACQTILGPCHNWLSERYAAHLAPVVAALQAWLSRWFSGGAKTTLETASAGASAEEVR